MRYIAVESQTLTIRHGGWSQTLSTIRPADFAPFFVEFQLSLRYPFFPRTQGKKSEEKKVRGKVKKKRAFYQTFEMCE